MNIATQAVASRGGIRWRKCALGMTTRSEVSRECTVLRNRHTSLMHVIWPTLAQHVLRPAEKQRMPGIWNNPFMLRTRVQLGGYTAGIELCHTQQTNNTTIKYSLRGKVILDGEVILTITAKTNTRNEARHFVHECM